MCLSARQEAIEVYWAEMAPCDHIVEIYEHDQEFLDSLESFVYGGLSTGDGVVVLATPLHRAALEERLGQRNIDIQAARARDQYIALDADETVRELIVDGWPDEVRFFRFVRDLLKRARGNGRQVRAFGELVAIMWAQGHQGGAVRLEHLWHHLCLSESFPLFCAYPRCGFTKGAAQSIREICEAHTKVLTH